MSIAETFSRTFPAPAWWRDLDVSQRFLGAALVLSTVAHAFVLAITFAPQLPSRKQPLDTKLDVILVNAKHAQKPVKPDALAQADLDGGGTAAKGRAKSFLPASRQVQDGDELRETAVRIRQLEQEQKKLLAAMRNASPAVAATAPRPEAQPDPTPAPPAVTSADLYASTSAILRREAEIFKRIEDENARPKRGHIGPSTRSVPFAMYYNQWVEKVQRHGNNNYPEVAKGGRYELVMAVSLREDGSIEKIEVVRSSRNPDVDRAARRIVTQAGPYGAFSAAMKAEYGVIDLVVKWTFAREDALSVAGQN